MRKKIQTLQTSLPAIIFFLFYLGIQNVNAEAINMKLENIDGIKEPLSNYIGQGKWVVVNVWSPTCSACVTELPRIKKFMERNPETPILGVTIDFPSFGYGKADIIKSFIEIKPLNYPLFLADQELASEVIGRHLVGIPLIAVYRPDGKAVARWPGVVEINEIEKLIKNYEEDNDLLSSGFE